VERVTDEKSGQMMVSAGGDDGVIAGGVHPP